MIFTSPLARFRSYEYRRYQELADFITPRGNPNRAKAENAAALAWRLHHPIRHGLVQVKRKWLTRKGLAYQVARLADRLEEGL